MEYSHSNPDFFTAALMNNDTNPFDQSFGAGTGEDYGMDFSWQQTTSGLSPFPQASMARYPSPQPADSPFSNQQQQMYSTTGDHVFFDSLADDKDEQYTHTSLHKLATQIAPHTVRISNGQLTPVSKPVSPDHDFEAANIPEQDDQEATEPTPADSDPLAKPKRTRRTRKRNPPSAEQEAEKREKLLERNRVAASKCRQKRKSYTCQLEEQARELQVRKDSLSMLANSLKEEVLFLKGQMLRHTDCTCTRVREYLHNESDALTCARHSSTFVEERSQHRDARHDSVTSSSSFLSAYSEADSTSVHSPIFKESVS